MTRTESSDPGPEGSGLTRKQALRLGLLAAAATAVAPRVLAQEAGHAGHAMPMGEMTPSTEGYIEANDRMHAAMAIDYTGDADIDFARGMIPHHEGAIAMAKVLLANGQDEDLRRLAQEIIEAQQAEIAFLINWLDARGA